LPALPHRHDTKKAANPDATTEPDDAQPAADPGGLTVVTSDTSSAIHAVERLRSSLLWSQLPDPSALEQEALLWWRLKPEMDRMGQVFTPSRDELNLALNPLRYRERVAHAAAALLCMNPPDQWVVFPRCQGKRWRVAPGIECAPCGGTGFIITYEGDPLGAANNEPDAIVDGDSE
jgi:hypothetical protein